MLCCPRSTCRSHRVVRSGFSAPVISSSERRRQRYACGACGKRFSDNFQLFGYRLKKSDPALNYKIFTLCLHGLSNRAIARLHFLSPNCVRRRIERLAQRALDFQAEKMSMLTIREAICFDGLENFAGSQYDPNNIQQAIGRDSLFIYDFNFAGMNRKGRTSPWQKLRLQQIVDEHGRFDPKAIRRATKIILQRLLEKRIPNEPLQLLSDEHFLYRHAIADLPNPKDIEHTTISSKACRNFQNILFSVNHADLMIRQQLGAFARETISFSKTAGAMCQKYALYLVYKNYLVPQFTKKHVRRPEAHEQSPAQRLAIADRILRFADIFAERSLEAGSNLNEEWKEYWLGRVPAAYQRSLNFR